MLRIPGILSLPIVAALLVAPAAAPAQGAPEGPLSVDDVVRIALENNFTHLRAQAAVDAAGGSRLQSLAGILPSVGGSASYTDADRTQTSTVTEVNGVPFDLPDLPQDSQVTSTGFSFSVDESFGLPQWYRYRSSVASLDAARHGLEATRQDLAYQVRQQFYLVLRAQDLLTVQEEDLRLARDEERRINTMFELGSVARVDVLKAQVRVSDAEVALIRQRNQVAIETSRLATLIGLPPNSRLALAGNLDAAPAPIDSLQAAEDALGRPDLRQARANLGSVGSLYRAAVTSRLPSLFATLSYNSSTSDFEQDQLQQDRETGEIFPFSSKGESESDGWTLRVGASVSLDAFINMGEHKRAHAQKRQAEYDLENTKLTVAQELEEAILNYRASVSSIEAAERGVAAAEEDLRLSQERYQQGLGTVLELLEAQVNLTRARNNLVNALTGLKISEAALMRARGLPVE